MELYEILTQRRKALGLSLDDLVLSSGVPKGTLSKIMAGITKSPEFETVRAIADSLGMSLEELSTRRLSYTVDEHLLIDDFRQLDPHGQRAVRAILDVELSRASDSSVAMPPSVVRLRRYLEPAAAGVPLWAEDGYEYIDFPAVIVPDGTDFAVGISGQSMEPDYPDGCTVFVRRITTPEDGDVVLVWLDGEGTTCKRVVAPFGCLDRLESINPSFPSFSGPQLENMRIYGKVIGYMAK